MAEIQLLSQLSTTISVSALAENTTKQTAETYVKIHKIFENEHGTQE